MTLFCPKERETRWFRLGQDSIYHCPCGNYAWNPIQQDIIPKE